MSDDSPHPVQAPWRLYLHYFDIHFLEEKRAGRSRAVRTEAALATRLAVLAADEVLVPAASFFESSLCRSVLGKIDAFYGTGILWLVGNAASAEEFRRSKLAQYSTASPQGKNYATLRTAKMPPFRATNRSSTAHLLKRWDELLLDRPEIVGKLKPPSFTPSAFELRWSEIASRIGPDPFIVANVAPLLLERDVTPERIMRLHGLINEGYFSGYTSDLQAGLVRNLIYLSETVPVPSRGLDLNFRGLLEVTRGAGLLSRIAAASGEELLQLRYQTEWRAALAASLSYLSHAEAMIVYAAALSGRASAQETLMVLRKIKNRRAEAIVEELAQWYEKLSFLSAHRPKVFEPGALYAIDAQMKDARREIAKLEDELASILISTDWVEQLEPNQREDLVREIEAAFGRTAVGNVAELAEPVREVRQELAQSGKSATAKLKVAIPIIPMVARYELELDTEAFVAQVWTKIKSWIGLAPRA